MVVVGREMRPVGPTAEGQTFAITLSLSSPEVLVDYTLYLRLLVIRAFPAPRHRVVVSQYIGIRIHRPFRRPLPLDVDPLPWARSRPLPPVCKG
jgi:hypothetical protein